MTIDVSTPWHKASYDVFLNERLPALLAERLPLLSYAVNATDAYTCRVVVTLASPSGPLDVSFDLPQPDDSGLFIVGEQRKVVVPLATDQELDNAEIRCVGEQLYDIVAARLGQAPLDLPWDLALARAWLPLDSWIGEFMAGVGDRFVTAQSVEQINWLARHTHLRRIIVPERGGAIAPGQMGYVCPFETPEGPNIGHVFTVAVGATILGGKLVIVDERPEATLGLSASMIPLLEHDDPNRILMGANMLRQWVPQDVPEPALVRTGNEPDALLSPEFWTGRNLLTAFVSWGAGTYEDAIVVSESCARRFDAPYALQLGDKLSNRHGTKGLVGRILPDDEMPHLSDGTPVELVFNFANLHRRMNYGQIREALLGRIAQAEGGVVVVPPFAAPAADELRARLVAASLPESGMEVLTLGKDGPPLQRPSTVGWIYWGRLFHLAKDKLHTFASAGERWGQVQGEMENFMLRDLGAFENIREGLNTRAVRRADVETLEARLAAGSAEQAPPPTPILADLRRRLRVAGIEVVLESEGLEFRFAPPQEDALRLARPVPHPWLPERPLTELGVPESGLGSGAGDVWDVLWPPGGWRDTSGVTSGAYTALVDANDRLTHMLAVQTPGKLVDSTAAQLERHVRAFFDELLTSIHLRLSERQLFSARTVLIPAVDLSLEQVGMPEEMAWALFRPLVVRELGGDENAVTNRNGQARQVLDAVMARSWVIVNRAPTIAPTALLAFHPKRVPDNALETASALHLHPLVCKWMDADFDGDQAAVLLPITEAAQREAGERLSVAAHLTRDPDLLASLVPSLDALWGLAELSRDAEGLEEIAHITGEPVHAPGGFATATSLTEALRRTLAKSGVKATLSTLERLMHRGFEAAKASGASLSPFVGDTAPTMAEPSTDDAERWQVYAEAVAEAISSCSDYDSPDMGPQLLMGRARGVGLEQLAWLVAGRGPVVDERGRTVIVRHGYGDGLSPEEMLACVPGARRGLAEVIAQWKQMGATFRERNVTRSFSVLTRALRAKYPGLVFARAAAAGEVDPLVDVESRLIVGLPVERT